MLTDVGEEVNRKEILSSRSLIHILRWNVLRMTTMEERQSLAKLEALKDIRNKTIALEKLRLRLLHDIECVEGEEKCLGEYRREMEFLQQEKMAHVEELRQIHADINAMETVMKQAEEARRGSQESARRIYEDYGPLKQDVDLMRTELLGLEKLPDLLTDSKDKLTSMGISDKPKMPNMMLEPWHHHHPHSEESKSFASLMSLGRAAAAAAAAGNAPPPPPNPFLAAAAAQHSAMGLGPLPGMGSKGSSAVSSNELRNSSSGPTAVPPPFRQQPPPMKSCLSCHQQIHRNAPICPLCKAKSRSRNPKKPKKKE
ncbi:Zinc finger C4H2 domain-containing protein [Lepeophtheirus salmonis]|uniref:Zinc finger C4H2 domain-containing protein n=3 Tax=Lepeophtheirus salmonis TaxID=72036 RepID=A0A7R8D1V5_LEPSM|nr:Zinc finger C4H2 domain-containing protein [Lepeophtheirus salmonis]CAF2951644.1 Zinc finger C4H2 domain-containing protein [Lepeophtheirus salmonis]